LDIYADPQIRISVGTFSQTFDDLTISVQIPGEKRAFMAILPPSAAKLLLDQLSQSLGKDGDEMLMIPLHEQTEQLTWQQAREKYASQYWLLRDNTSGK
jgi:hypothetical protein